MKILKLALILIFILLVGGFGFFAFVDVPVSRNEVSKEIPNERFFND